MQMNQEDNIEIAYDLLRQLRVKKLKSMLKKKSDKEFAEDIAVGLIGGKGVEIPATTIELAARVREIVQVLIKKEYGNKKINKYEMKHVKTRLDSTVARVM